MSLAVILANIPLTPSWESWVNRAACRKRHARCCSPRRQRTPSPSTRKLPAPRLRPTRTVRCSTSAAAPAANSRSSTNFALATLSRCSPSYPATGSILPSTKAMDGPSGPPALDAPASPVAPPEGIQSAPLEDIPPLGLPFAPRRLHLRPSALHQALCCRRLIGTGPAAAVLSAARRQPSALWFWCVHAAPDRRRLVPRQLAAKVANLALELGQCG